MEFSLLGSVEARVGGQAVPLGGAKPRALLAALLLERGRVVPVARLVDVIWGDDPPPTARALVQTYVKNLRQAFAKHSDATVIATRAPGYVATVSADAVDKEVFERLLAQSRTADPQRSVGLLRQALALWRGPALAGLEDSWRLAAEALRLDELWLTAVTERIAAELDLDRLDHLAELTALVDTHPTDERLRGQLMTTLCRLGRQADALATYRQGRDLLVDELGVEPGEELAALHNAILRGELPSAAESSVRTMLLVPSQLPPALPDFTGRTEEMAGLLGATPPIRVISGPGGSGKTSLAIRVSADLAPSFPDGRLYAELRGMSDAPTQTGEVLGRFLRALGVPDDRIPDVLAERSDLYRTVLADRRVLVLLDDARDEEQVRPLLPGGGDCAVIVTSRNRLAGLAGASLVELDVFNDADAGELLRRLVGQDRVDAEPQAAALILKHCGNVPLAIRIAGARLVSRRHWPLRLLADRLADESRRLTELCVGDLAVRASIGSSYHALDPAQQTVLRRMGFLGLPDFSTWVVGWLMDVPKASAEQLVEALVDAQVVDSAGADAFGGLRYRLHDLVRLYAAERAAAEEPRADLVEAVARTLRGWLALIDRIGADAPPAEVSWRHTTTRAYLPAEQMAARVSADPGDWFTAEQPSLVAGVERAAALGLHQLVCEFASTRYCALTSGTNRFEVGARVNAAALAAARAAGDLRGEAVMLAEWGKLHYFQDDYAQARALYTEALTRFRQIGDSHAQAATLVGLGTACREPGHLVESLHFLQQAARLFAELDDTRGMAYLRRLSGSVHLEMGSFARAHADLEESLAAYRAAGDRRGEAFTVRTLGLYHRARGSYPEAARLCRQATETFRGLGDEHMQAYALRALAKCQLRLHRPGVAESLEWALTVCQSLGDLWGQAATLHVLGEAHLAAGRLDLAGSCLETAALTWDSIDAPLWRARTERRLADLHAARGQHDDAEVAMKRALRVFHDHGAREYAEITATR